MLAKSHVFMKKILGTIACTKKLPEFELPTLHDRKLYMIGDKPLVLINYITKFYGPIVVLQKVIRRFSSAKVESWSVAYTKFDGYKKSLWRYKEVKNPANRFLADPFVYTKDGRTIIFVEDYFVGDDRGRISAIDVSEGQEIFLGVVLEEGFHLSYPFVFEGNGSIYMIPETHKAREIRLYECEEFPTKWKFKKALMSDVSAADTMIFSKDSAWFMLTNICSANIGDHCSELHVFYSDRLVSDDWKPLACGNPIVFDPMRARNGGMFRVGDNIYRVNQIHSKNHYGRAFAINLVTRMDKGGFEERRIDTVEPFFKDGIISTHHFNSDGCYCVVDFMRRASRKELGKACGLMRTSTV